MDLSKANIVECDFSNATFRHMRLSNTKFKDIIFDRSHSPLQDGSETIRLSGRDRRISWGKLRAIGRFPLFNVSWGGFILIGNPN